MKINIDGLLALNLEQIQIVFRRCRGDSVQKIANEMGIGASTIYEGMHEIFELLEVKDWRELEKEACVPLRRIITGEEALARGWPEAFREKIEALRDPIEPQTQTTTVAGETPPESLPSTNQSESESRADSEHFASIPPVSGSKAESIPNTQRQETRRDPFPWYFIAIPGLLLCLVCISAFMFGRGMVDEWFSRNNATATSTLAPQVPPSTETSLPTDTPLLLHLKRAYQLLLKRLPPPQSRALQRTLSYPQNPPHPQYPHFFPMILITANQMNGSSSQEMSQ